MFLVEILKFGHKLLMLPPLGLGMASQSPSFIEDVIIMGNVHRIWGKILIIRGVILQNWGTTTTIICLTIMLIWGSSHCLSMPSMGICTCSWHINVLVPQNGPIHLKRGAELTEDDQLEPDLWLEELELTRLLGNLHLGVKLQAWESTRLSSSSSYWSSLSSSWSSK